MNQIFSTYLQIKMLAISNKLIIHNYIIHHHPSTVSRPDSWLLSHCPGLEDLHFLGLIFCSYCKTVKHYI